MNFLFQKPLFFRLPLCLVFVAAVHCTDLTTGRTWAQVQGGNVGAPPKPVLPVFPETEEFKTATEAMREHVKKARELLVRFNVGEDPVKDQQYREQWAELIAAGEPIRHRLIEAAVAEYKTNPKGKVALAEMLWELIDKNVEVDRYEGLLNAIEALRENGYQDDEGKLLSTLAITAFALNEYDRAKPLMDEMVAEGSADPQVVGLQQELAGLKKLWEKELAARKSDAAGEPLPRVLMRTSKGNIEIELFENQAPETVGNFIHLVENGFYNGVTFHRVLKHFMAQTGCPIGDGTGDPGYKIYGEMKKPNARDFFRGTLGLALAQDPNSGGSQFFICFTPAFHLNGSYTAFGRVVDGIEVLGNINQINPDEKKDESEPAQMPDEVYSIEVLQKRDHEYTPNKVRAN